MESPGGGGGFAVKKWWETVGNGEAEGFGEVCCAACIIPYIMYSHTNARCDVVTNNMVVPRPRTATLLAVQAPAYTANLVSKRNRRMVHGYLWRPISSGRRVGTSDSSYVHLEAKGGHLCTR